MKNFKKIIFLFLFVTIIFSVNSNASKIDDLLNSYNYSYSNKNLNLILNNSTIYNSNIYNSSNSSILNFSILINNRNNDLRQNNYTFIFGTYNRIIETNKILFKKLNFGNNLLNFNLSLNYLNLNNYSIYFLIYQDNLLIYRNYNLFNFKTLKNLTYNFSKNEIISNQNYIFRLKDLNKFNNFSLNNTKKINVNNYLDLNQFNNSFNLNNFNNSNFFDISINNIYYNKSNGNISIIIKNIGKRNIFGLNLKIFNKNLSLINSKFIEYILINKTLKINTKININFSKFLVQVNSINNGEINYKNNFLFWPINLTEICGDNLDNNRNGLIDENCLKNNFLNNINNSSNNIIKNNIINNKINKIISSGGNSGGSGGGIRRINLLKKNTNIKNKNNLNNSNNTNNEINSDNLNLNLKNEIKSNNKIKIIKYNNSKRLNNSIKNFVNNSNLSFLNNSNKTLFKQFKPFINFNFNKSEFENKTKFLEKNKITISGVLFGFFSIIFYILFS